MADEKRLISVDAHKLEELLRECFDVIKSIKPTELSLMGTLLVWIGCCKKPTVDAVEVVHGRWERVIPTKSAAKWSTKVSCSICHKQGYTHHKFCPHCGAKMDGGNSNV